MRAEVVTGKLETFHRRNGNSPTAAPPRLDRVSTSFLPHPLVRSAALQTTLSTIKGEPEIDSVVANEQPLLLDGGPDKLGVGLHERVRLLAYYNQTPADTSRGLVLLLHGWEGCSHSSYNLLTSTTLLQAGYDVMRLNFRDHGPNLHVDAHALNEGVFLGTMIDEVATAGRQVARLAGDQPFFIVGASLGGNFALRMARAHRQEPFHNLQRVIAFSPALNPDRATRAIDEQTPYRLYFRRRWGNSLRRKQALFPDRYDFTHVLNKPTLYEMTDILAREWGIYRSAADYFGHYTLTGDALQEINVPTTIMTALDDAVIPAVDVYSLAPHPLLEVQIERYGGHVGWIDLFPFRHRLPQMLLDFLAR
jgi:predicted alpha/beta-fold hydrolase